MDKKELIRIAATKIIAKEGFFKTKVQDIAQGADIAVGTIYIYFKSKDMILDYIFETQHKKVEIYSRELEGKNIPPLEKIKKMLIFHFDQMKTNPDLARVLSQEDKSNRNIDFKLRNDGSTGASKIFQKILEESKGKGEIRDINTGLFGAIIFFVGKESAYQMSINGNNDKHYETFNEIITFINNGIRI